MGKVYTTIQQHEPLRVPSNWNGQEKRFISQLEEILDDIYSRYNRLRLKDFSEEAQEEIMGPIDESRILDGTIQEAMIANGAVTANKVAAGAIIAAKIATDAVTADKILSGAVTAVKIEDGAVTANKIASNAVTVAKIADDAVTADKIISGAVTAVKIEDGAVTANKIAASAVTTDKIDAGAITVGKIANDAVTADKIISGAVTSVKIQDGAVVANKIGAGAVTTDKLTANAVTAAKIDIADLFAATATINQLNAWNIWGNSYLSLSVGRIYNQNTDPTLDTANTVKNGDIWIKTNGDQYVRENGVWEKKYSVVSGIDIVSAGVEISGSKYVKIKSGGSFVVDSGNFSIDTNGNVSINGSVTASSGAIGGWDIGTNKLSSGTSTSYVEMSTTGDYAFSAGNSTVSSAPFRVKRDGTVYLTKLVALTEQGGTTTVDLQNYPFWKLNYHTVKAYGSDSITLSNGAVINFNSAAPTYLDSEWVGNTYNYYVKDQDNQVILSGSITLTPNPAQTGISGSPLTNFDAQHKMSISVGATGIQGPLFYWAIDASGEYTAGVNKAKAEVTLTQGGWLNGSNLVSANNAAGQTSRVYLPTITLSGGTSFNSSHKTTVYASGGGASNVANIEVDATSQYKAGNNYAYAAQSVVGTCYTIVAHSGDWVKVQEIGTGYTRVAYMN